MSKANSRYVAQAAQFAGQLRKLRESAGITQERLAAEAGVSIATVRKIETRGRSGAGLLHSHGADARIRHRTQQSWSMTETAFPAGRAAPTRSLPRRGSRIG